MQIQSSSFEKEQKTLHYELKRLVETKKFGPLLDKSARCIALTTFQGRPVYVKPNTLNQLDLWDIERYRVIHCFEEAHNDQIYSLAASSDQKVIISGSADNTIAIWSLENKALIHRFEDAHTGPVTSLIVSKDNKIVASASLDKSIAIWDINAKKLLHRFEMAHTNGICEISMSSDREYIVSAGEDHIIAIWSISKQKIYHRFVNAHCKSIYSVTFTPDNRYIISGSADGTLGVWDWKAKTMFQRVENKDFAEIWAVTVSEDSKKVIFGSDDGTLSTWDLSGENNTKGPLKLSNEEYPSPICFLLPANKGKSLVSSYLDGRVMAWELSNNEKRYLNENVSGLTSLKMTADTKYIVGTGSKNIIIWDFEQEKMTHNHYLEGSREIRTSIVTEDGKMLLTAYSDHTVGFWEFPKLNPVGTINVPYERGTLSGVQLAVTHDNKTIVYTAKSENDIIIIDFKTKKVIHKFPEQFVGSIALSKDSRYLATGSENSNISVWDLVEMKLMNRFVEPGKQWVLTVRFTDDDQLIANAWGGPVHIWNYKDTQNTAPIKSFTLPESYFYIEVLGEKMIWHGYYQEGCYLNYKELDVETESQFTGIQYTSRLIYGTSKCKDVRGNYLVSETIEGIEVWDATELKPVCKLNDLTSHFLWDFQISADSKSIIAPTRSNHIEIWDLEKNVLEHRFPKVHEHPIFYIARSKNGTYLVSVCSERTLAIWNLEEKELVAKIEKADTDSIRSLAITDDSTMIIAQTSNGIHLWDLSTQEKIHTFSGSFVAVTVDSNSKYMVAANSDKSLTIFDIQNQEELNYITGAHTSNISAVKLTPDGKRVISGSADKSIAVWDVASRKLLHRFKDVHNKENIACLAVDNEGKYAFSGSDAGGIGVIDLENLVLKYYDKNLHAKNIEGMTVSPDGKYLATMSSGGTIGLLKLKEDLLISKFNPGHSAYIRGMAMTHDNNFLITASQDGSVIVYDLFLERIEWHIENAHADWIRELVLTEDEKYIVTSSADRTVAVWSIEERKLHHRFETVHVGMVKGLAYAPGTNIVVTGSDDKSIAVLDVVEKKVIYQISEAHNGAVIQVATAANGRYIASTGEDGTVALWERTGASYALKNRFKYPNPYDLWGVAITSDPQRIIASDGQTIYIWRFDQDSDEPPQELRSEQNKSHIYFHLSKDSRYLIASSQEDKSIYVWNLHKKNCFYRFEHEDFEGIWKLIFTDDLRYIFCVLNSYDIGITKTSFVTNDPELQRDKIPTLHAIDCLLDVDNRKYTNEEASAACRALTGYYYIPNGWDFLNFLAFMLPNVNTTLLDTAIENNISLGIDVFGKTQVDYLLEFQGKKNPLLVQKFNAHFFKNIAQFINLQVLDAPKMLNALARSIPIIFETQTEISFINYLSCFSLKPEGNLLYSHMLPLQGEIVGGNGEKAFAELADLTYNQNELAGVVSDEGKTTLSYTLLSIPLSHKIYSEDSLTFIQMLNDSPSVFFYEASVVRNLIDFYWEKSKKYLWWWLLFNLIPVGLFTAFALIRTDHYSTASGLLAGVMSINTLLLIFEILQVSSNFDEYVQDPFNFIETVIILVQYVTAVLFWGDYSGSALSFFVSLSTLLWYTKLLVLMRAIDQLRKLIRMIIEIITDSMGFMTVIFTYILGFTIAMYQSRRASDTEDLNFWEVALEMYTFGIGSYDSSNYSGVTMPFFIIATFLMPLILLNMLIALMGDTYGRSKENATSIDIKERIAMISEMATTVIQIRKIFEWITFRKGQTTFQKQYLLVVEPYEQIEENMTVEERIDEIKQQNIDLKTVVLQLKADMDGRFNRLEEAIKSIKNSDE